jgi:hypothetical protein
MLAPDQKFFGARTKYPSARGAVRGIIASEVFTLPVFLDLSHQRSRRSLLQCNSSSSVRLVSRDYFPKSSEDRPP